VTKIEAGIWFELCGRKRLVVKRKLLRKFSVMKSTTTQQAGMFGTAVCYCWGLCLSRGSRKLLPCAVLLLSPRQRYPPVHI